MRFFNVRRLRIILLVLLLSFATCQPFYVSTFPTFLADTVDFKQISFINTNEIFSYDFFSLRNDTGEYIFFITIPYTGKVQLYILNDKLETIDTTDINDNPQVNFLASKLRMVDVNQNFLIGGTLLNIEDNQATYQGDITIITSNNNFGAVVVTETTSYNCLFDKNTYNAISLILYTIWGTNNTRTYHLENNSNLEIVNAKRTSEKGLTALVTWEERTNGERQAFCYLFKDGNELPNDGSNIYPNFPLDSVASSHDSVYAMVDGLLVRTFNGSWCLFDWDTGRLISQNCSLCDPSKLIAFGEKNYYYVFDPQTLYLYKVSYWWQK